MPVFLLLVRPTREVSIHSKGLNVAESRSMSGEQPIGDWVEAASCTWLHEAAFLQSVLGAAGIDATIPNEHTLGVQPLYANLLGGVRGAGAAGRISSGRERFCVWLSCACRRRERRCDSTLA